MSFTSTGVSHDLKYLGPDGENLTDPKDPKNHQQVPPEEYREKLQKLVSQLKNTEAILIWRNTTPVPPRLKGPEWKGRLPPTTTSPSMSWQNTELKYTTCMVQ